MSGDRKTNYPDVPVGIYDVKVEKLRIESTHKDEPRFACWFRIDAGEYKNRLLFMNVLLLNEHAIQFVLEFIDSLNSKENILFEKFSQFDDLLKKIHEQIQNVVYKINYTKNKKGFPNFKIKGDERPTVTDQ